MLKSIESAWQHGAAQTWEQRQKSAAWGAMERKEAAPFAAAVEEAAAEQVAFEAEEANAAMEAEEAAAAMAAEAAALEQAAAPKIEEAASGVVTPAAPASSIGVAEAGVALAALSRKELQARAKQAGIKANQKSVEIIKQLEALNLDARGC